jgi:hypothetical protein
MILTEKDNKIYLYDKRNDKYILVESEDLPHILDDENKPLPDYIIDNYFKFKYHKFKENPKGYISKKINLKKQYEDIKGKEESDYIVHKFLSKFNGLDNNKILQFIKNPTETTIKNFDISFNDRSEMLESFRELKKEYDTIQKKGNNFKDIYEFITSKDNNFDTVKIASEAIKTWIDDEDVDKNELINNVITLKSKLPYETVNNIVKSIEEDFNDKEKLKFNVDKILLKIDKITVNPSDFGEYYEQNKDLIDNLRDKVIEPIDILKLKGIKNFKNKPIKNSALLYRLLTSDTITAIGPEPKEGEQLTLTLLSNDNDNKEYQIKVLLNNNSVFGKEFKKLMDTYRDKMEGIDNDKFKEKLNDLINKNPDQFYKSNVEDIDIDFDKDYMNHFDNVYNLSYSDFNKYIDNLHNLNNEYVKPMYKNEKLFKNSNYNKRLFYNLPETEGIDFSKLEDSVQDIIKKNVEGKKEYDKYIEDKEKYDEDKAKYDEYVKQQTIYNKYVKNAKNYKKYIEDKKEYDKLTEEEKKEKEPPKEVKKPTKVEKPIKVEKPKEVKEVDEVKELTPEQIQKQIYEYVEDNILKGIEDKKKQENIKKVVEDYTKNIIEKLSYYNVDDSDYLDNRTKKSYQTKYPRDKLNEKIYDQAFNYKYNTKDKRNKYFEGKGGSWSYDVLNKIEELNNNLTLKSNGKCGSWSYDVLNKIEELNKLIN